MTVNYPPDLSGVEKKINDGIEQLKKLEWYQKPLGIFILGFFLGFYQALFYL